MSSMERTLARAKKKEEDRKERVKKNSGKATKAGFFGTGNKVKWLYPVVTHSEARARKH